MALKSNKKGIFFTALVLVIATILLLTYAISTIPNDRSVLKKRVQTMNEFLISSESDLERQLYVMGFRAIFVFNNHIAQQGTYISNPEISFQELAYNGTLYQQNQSLFRGITFRDIENTLQQRAQKLNINITLLNPMLALAQSDPWKIDIALNTTIIMTDENNLVSWNRSLTITARVPVQGLEDPLYIVNTNGLVTVKVKQTPHIVFVENTNITSLLNHTLSSYYRAHADAPSFISRLQGNLSASPYGIESLVNLQKLAAQGVPTQQKTVVDYLYFSTQNPAHNGVSGMPSWFRLDAAHLAYYNASHLAI